MKWTPDMVISLVIIGSCVVLIATGIDGEVKAILGMAGAWAFGRQYQVTKQSKGEK